MSKATIREPLFLTAAIGLTAIAILYPRWAWLVFLGLIFLVFLRNWFYWRQRINGMVVEQLFYTYVYNPEFPGFALWLFKFSDQDIKKTGRLYQEIVRVISMEEPKPSNKKYLRRAKYFFDTARALPWQDPFRLISFACWVLAIAMPYLTYFYGGWQDRSAWLASLITSLMFAVGALGFGYISNLIRRV